MENKRKLSAFWRIYLIVFGVIIVILALLLVLGYNVMMDYHESQSYPSESANNYAKSLIQGSYSLLCDDQSNAACVFEKDYYTDLMNKKLSGSEIVCTKGFSADRYARPVYRIKADGESIADVAYKLKEDKSTFGFALYDFENIYSLIKGDYSISFIIPNDAKLFLNNIEVGDNWITENNIERAYNSEANLYGEVSNTSTVSFKKYVIDGLFAEPFTQVTDSAGNLLNVTYNTEMKAFCTIQDIAYILAPDNFNISVNGIDITGQEKFIAEKEIVFEELNGIKEYMTDDISLVKYMVTGVDVSSLDVVAENYAGVQTPVYYDIEKGYYRVYSCALEEDGKYNLLDKNGITEERLMSYAKYYAAFVANDKVDGKDRWGTIMPYVMPGSELYETFDSFWSVLAKHNSYWYAEDEIIDISFYAEDAFSCRTSFVYWIKGFDGDAEATKDYPTDVTFYYVKKEGVWYITDWELHTETE